MIEAVHDGSALLADRREEPGTDRVDPVPAAAPITSVNWAEVVQKSLATGVEGKGRRQALAADATPGLVLGGPGLPEPGAGPQPAGAQR